MFQLVNFEYKIAMDWQVWGFWLSVELENKNSFQGLFSAKKVFRFTKSCTFLH